MIEKEEMSGREQEEGQEDPQTLLGEDMSEDVLGQTEPAEARQDEGVGPVSIYIGPSFPGVKRYTVYDNGLPDELREKLLRYPVFRGLVIPVQGLAQANRGLMERGSAIDMMYKEAERYLRG